jgi:hypothetical protein
METTGEICQICPPSLVFAATTYLTVHCNNCQEAPRTGHQMAVSRLLSVEETEYQSSFFTGNL